MSLMVALAMFSNAATTWAQEESQPIEYELSFPDARNHYVDVAARIPVSESSGCELMMATWTPGSYLIREYARHVDEITAETLDGKRLEIGKTTKNRWRVEGKDLGTIVVRYRLYCRELSVRTNFVDREFAVLNGAPTFITSAAQLDSPHHVAIRLPDGWRQSVTALDERDGAGAGQYVARDFDHLVDSPIVVGNPEVQTFSVSEIEHQLVNVGGNGLWDGAKATQDVAKIVAEQHRLWGKVPYRRYFFLNVIAESGGGLEHDESTLMLTSRWAFRRPEDYRRWLGLVSHEFFHAWNIRTLRPKALVDYDYENENYFPSLWIAEGITSYYDDLMLRRSGVVDRAEYLKQLSRQIGRVETTPGRLVQSLTDASHDAWIKYYRQDEHSANAQVSYYIKGAVVGFLLDMKIRSLTNDEKSLDDVMREVYRRYSGERGYTEAQFRQVASKVAGTNLSEWFEVHVDQAGELDYQPALDWLGLKLDGDDKSETQDAEKETSDSSTDKAIVPWLGASTRAEEGRLMVSRVTRDSPAYEAGINVDDEMIAINGFRVDGSNLDKVLGQFGSEKTVSVTLARRGELIELTTEIREEPKRPSKLSVLKEPSDEQKSRLKSWLGE